MMDWLTKVPWSSKRKIDTNNRRVLSVNWNIMDILNPDFTNTEKYWPLFQDENVLFHSIWEFNWEKLMSCVHNGIISEKERERNIQI